MRLTALVAAAAITLFAGTAQSAPVELAVNGGFETGDFAGWTQFPSAPGQQTVITPGFASTYAGCINNVQTTSASVIKNANIGVGIVTPFQTVTISFDARGQGVVGGVAFAEFFSELAGGGVSSSVLLGGAPLALNADPNTWTHFTFTTTTGADVSGGVTLQFAVVTGAAPGSAMTLYVDNASVVVEGVVSAEPTSWGQVKNSHR